MKENDRNKDGKFVKGHTGLKLKGAKNKSTNEMKERLQLLMENYDLEKMIADMKNLKPADRLKVMTGLLEYFLPKLNKSDFSLTKDHDEIIVLLPE